MAIRAAIFDLDGTLLDSMGVWERVDVEFLGRRGIAVPRDYGDSIRAMNLEEGAAYTIRRFGLAETVDELTGEWLSMVEQEYRYRVGLTDYASEYLTALKRAGIRLAAATCSRMEIIAPCLERNGIFPLFDAVVTAEMAGCGKERPDIFLLAAGLLGVEPGECVVFDDALSAIRSAKAAGMTAYGVYDITSAHRREEMEKIADGYLMSLRDAPVFPTSNI